MKITLGLVGISFGFFASMNSALALHGPSTLIAMMESSPPCNRYANSQGSEQQICAISWYNAEVGVGSLADRLYYCKSDYPASNQNRNLEACQAGVREGIARKDGR